MTLAVAVGASVFVACSDAARKAFTSSAPVRLRTVELAAEDPLPGGTYVILENRRSSPVGVGCWRIRTGRGVRTIKAPAVVPSSGGLRLLFDRGDVGNPDRVTLINRAGQVVDATPLLHDTKSDDRSFSRVAGRWTLGRAPLPSRVIEGRFLRPGSGC